MLKFPPIKQPKLTKYITYKIKSKQTDSYFYHMVDRTGNIVGKMKAKPETIYDKHRHFSPGADVYRSFFIDRLFAYKKNSGVGRAFINIAKKESLRNFCLGNVHTIASSRFDQTNPPYVFFRKMGFEFGRFNSLMAKHVDECIKTNSKVNSKVYGGDIPMYIAKNVDIDGKELAKQFNLKRKFPELFKTLP